jgi:hypothetical protein
MTEDADRFSSRRLSRLLGYTIPDGLPAYGFNCPTEPYDLMNGRLVLAEFEGRPVYAAVPCVIRSSSSGSSSDDAGVVDTPGGATGATHFPGGLSSGSSSGYGGIHMARMIQADFEGHDVYAAETPCCDFSGSGPASRSVSSSSSSSSSSSGSDVVSSSQGPSQGSASRSGGNCAACDWDGPPPDTITATSSRGWSITLTRTTHSGINHWEGYRSGSGGFDCGPVLGVGAVCVKDATEAATLAADSFWARTNSVNRPNAAGWWFYSSCDVDIAQAFHDFVATLASSVSCNPFEIFKADVLSVACGVFCLSQNFTLTV